MPIQIPRIFVTNSNLNAGDFVVLDREYLIATRVNKAVITSFDNYFGYVLVDCPAGTSAPVFLLGGVNTALSGLTPGLTYYANPLVPGGITSTIPTGTPIIQVLGVAISATELDTQNNYIEQGTGGSPTGPAGGDLTGTYPNPGVNWANGLPTYDLQYYPLTLNPAGYLTSITAGDITTALGYTPYDASNPAGYITSASLAGYLTVASAAATYYPLSNPSGFISGITSLDVTTALGYTPYDSANPANYISGITSGDVTTALGFTPYDAANPAGYIDATALTPYLTAATAAATYQPFLTYLVFVESTADLPTPVAGVITLANATTYFFTTEVDLLGDRLVAGINTTIIGGSSENCRIKSTGLVGTALITSNYSLPIRNITIEADVALNLDGDATTTAIDWFGVNFTDCATVGLIKDYTNVIMQDSAFLNSGGLTFDGTIGTIGFSQCLFNCNPANTIFILPSTLTVTRRFRIIYSSLLVLAGETGINVNALTSIPNDGYILTYCNFSGGGTYLTGVDATSNKALFINNIGINNSSNVGHYYMQNNATATTVGAGNQNVWFKAAGTTVVGLGNSPKWTTAVTNRLTYAGSVTTDFVITIVGSIQTTANGVTLGVGVAENGTIQSESAVSVRIATLGVPFPFSVQDVIQVAPGDYFEVFVRNETGTQNITLVDVNVIIQKVTG